MAALVLVIAVVHPPRPRLRALGRSPLTVPVVVLVAELLFATDWDAVGSGAATVAVLVLVAAGPVALCWRRRAPVTAFVAVLGCFAVAAAAYFATWPGAEVHLPFLPPVVALYNVCARVRTRDLFVALAVASAVTTPAHVAAKVVHGAFAWPSGEAISFAIFLELLLALCAYGGHRARTHRDEIDELEAERAAVVRDERDRLARELHDIVSHAVSIIVLQAAGARTVLTSDPGRADEALVSIETSGRQAMGELRRLLTVLRDEPVHHEAVDHRRLGQIGELVEHIRDAGTPVAVSVEGQPSAIDPSVEHAAYRVVQEALTNACRYGDDRGATVEIDWRDGLVIDVRNDAAVAPRAATRDLSAGFGLVGLRERVSVIGGELDTSADPDGRHRVHVRLPTLDEPLGDAPARAVVGVA